MANQSISVVRRLNVRADALKNPSVAAADAPRRWKRWHSQGNHRTEAGPIIPLRDNAQRFKNVSLLAA
jgi:hypothetical protein